MRIVRKLASAVLVIVLVLASPGASAQGAQQRLITVRDAETEAMIQAFADPLFRAAGVNPALVRITLLQDWAINAFVTTGNRLFIHTGLIQRSGSAGEFIGVLAHETGHIAGGHVARLPEQMRAAMIRSVAAMLLGGAAAAASGQGEAAMAMALGGQHLAMREMLAFTRAQEQAADQAALTYLERNRWSPRGLASLLERLREQEQAAIGSRRDPYALTHPLSHDRLEFVREQLTRSRYADAPLPDGFEQRFAMVRAKLDGFLDSPATTWRRYPETDRSAPARYARAIAQLRSGHIAEAVGILDTVLREQPSNPYLHELKGQILFEGHRAREALAPYREAVRLAPQEPLIRLSYARVMIELGEPDLLRLAVRELETSLAQDRGSAFAWRQLGIAQGRLGNTAQADLALAEEALLRGDVAGARSLAAKAERALPAGPARLRAQDLRRAARQASDAR